jgi:glycosyltransferase involved in cell wall biosynthesis
MTRQENLRRTFTKDMRLIEIGASYSPIIPKAEGWQTTVVDRADRIELQRIYADVPGSHDIIEEVDYVWRDGPLLDAIPLDQHGTYDGLIASHVAEHVPDLVGFFLAADGLLKPNGVLMLALPDKRLCFDFFQPISTTGQVLDARGSSRHSRGVIFDNAAYYAERGGPGLWQDEHAVKITQSFDVLRSTFNATQTDVYEDAHHWRFTPASFQLLIMELNLLRVIPWAVACIEPQEAVEFMVWLERHKLPDLAANDRLALLREVVLETQRQVAQLVPPTIEPTAVRVSPIKPILPTISTIIPLYNGRRYIQETLESVLDQTVKPIEIIVVDDGSTDDGPALVKMMAEQHPITLLSKKNGGQSSARNFGIQHSTGQLIALLDHDDLWYPKHLEELVKPYLTPTDNAAVGWVYSDLDEIDSDGKMIIHTFLKSLLTPHPKTSIFECVCQDMFVLPSASLMRREAFDMIGGFDERLSGYEDDDLFIRLFRAGYANVFLPNALSKWRIFPASSSYSYRMRKSRAIFARKLLAEYPDDPQRDRYTQSDLISPRFYMHALAEYRNALMSGDAPLVAETREELLFWATKMPSRRSRMMGRILSKIDSPKIAKQMYRARHSLRPLVRRFIA